MKKFILSIIFGIGVLFSFSSCVTSAYAYGTDDVDVNVVVRYGTPYYYGGSLAYYTGITGLCLITDLIILQGLTDSI